MMAIGRRRRIGLSLVCALLLSACEQRADIQIYTAKTIITMDSRQPRAEAIAVADDRIVAVGKLEDVQQSLAGLDWQVNPRFENKVIMPGFIEPHLHPYLAGILLPMEFITPHDWDMPGKQVKGVRGNEAYLQRLDELHHTQDDDDWLWTWGYHPLFHGDMGRAELDQIAPDRPVVVWHRSFHEIILNTAALNALGLQPIDHPQVDWQRGHFYENGLMVVMPHLKKQLSDPWRYLKALKHARTIIHAGGVTTVSDGAFGTIDFDQEWQAIRYSSWNRSSSPFRFMVLPDGKSLGHSMGNEAAKQFMETLGQHDSEQIHFLPKQVKLFADGAAYSQLMQMRDGYLDGHHGEWLMTPEQLLQAARVYWRDGYQIHFHVNGDLGLDRTLDVVGTLQQEFPRQDHRTTVHHFAYAREDQAQRMARLGVRVSANPYYVWALADQYAEHGLGPDRARAMVPLKSVVDAGIPLSFHSDFTMAPVDPLRLAWVAVNRLSADGKLVGPEHRISVDAAMRAITIDAASQLQMEGQIGSLEVGKQADMTILEADPYEVPASTLKDIPIWGTMLGGSPLPLQADGGDKLFELPI